MKFFVPHAESDEQAISDYKSIKEFAEKQTWSILDNKIYKIKYRHNGKIYHAQVGEKSDFIQDLVLAIFESNAYLICTTNRGGIRGEPILVGKSDIISIECFD